MRSENSQQGDGGCANLDRHWFIEIAPKKFCRRKDAREQLTQELFCVHRRMMQRSISIQQVDQRIQAFQMQERRFRSERFGAEMNEGRQRLQRDVGITGWEHFVLAKMNKQLRCIVRNDRRTVDLRDQTRDYFTQGLIGLRVDGVEKALSNRRIFIGDRTEEFQANANHLVTNTAEKRGERFNTVPHRELLRLSSVSLAGVFTWPRQFAETDRCFPPVTAWRLEWSLFPRVDFAVRYRCRETRESRGWPVGSISMLIINGARDPEIADGRIERSRTSDCQSTASSLTPARRWIAHFYSHQLEVQMALDSKHSKTHSEEKTNVSNVEMIHRKSTNPYRKIITLRSAEWNQVRLSDAIAVGEWIWRRKRYNRESQLELRYASSTKNTLAEDRRVSREFPHERMPFSIGLNQSLNFSTRRKIEVHSSSDCSDTRKGFTWVRLLSRCSRSFALTSSLSSVSSCGVGKSSS